MMTCATCGAAVDVRARFLRVRSAAVVAFCSAPCAQGAMVPPAEAVAVLAPPVESAPAARPLESASALEKIGRWPMSWKVAANLAGASVAAALIGLLLQAVPSRPAPAVASTGIASREETPAPPLPERASALLDETMASDDPDLSFQAAEALTRLGRADAIGRLRATMREPGNPRRLRAARALLSRADPEARDLLRARLDSRRREERAFVARTLALAGDGAGREGLAALLSSPNTRLGAAEALAAIGDERGLVVLRRGLVSRDAETRARAAVALGRAGDPGATEELRRVLAERRFEVGAAIALASLDDEGARPALMASLGYSALRADAAEALARLGGASPAPLPETLGDALDNEPLPGQVQAALAILILAGAGR